MEFNELMKSFSQRLGIEDLEVQNGAAALIIDGMKIELIHNVNDESLLICGVVGEPPAFNGEHFGTLLLQANVLFQGTGGATFAQNPETKDFALQRSIRLAALDTTTFLSVMEKFVDQLERWRMVLADFRPIEQAAEESSQEPLPFGDFIQV